MLKIIILSWLMGVFISAAESSVRTQEPIEVNETLRSIDLSPALWFFEDVALTQTPDDLISPTFQTQFAPTDKRTPNFGFSNAQWWARILLRNTSTQPVTIYLTQDYALVDQIDFWRVDPTQGVVEHRQAGDRVPQRLQQIVSRVPSFKTQLPPGDSAIFFRIKTQGSLIFDITAQSEDDFRTTQVREYAFFSAMFGILIVMALYNLLMWIQLRRLTYLVYVGFIITTSSQYSITAGLGVHLLQDAIWIMNDGYLLIANVNLVMAGLFVIFFLSLPKRHPWLMRLAVLQIILALTGVMATFASYNMAAKLSVLAALLSSVITLAIGIACCINRFRPAYFFTLAWAVMLIANVMRMGMLAGSIPATFLIDWGVLIGSVFEVVLLSLAMADKMRVTEQAAFDRIEILNQNLQKEHSKVVALNNNLERMVDEQTREIKSILKHIQLGIMVVKKPDLQITATHSDSVRTLFETKEVTNRPIIELLFSHTTVSQEQRSQAQNALENCLDEDSINFEMNSHLLPAELVCRFSQDERIMQLDWNPVINQSGKIEKMLVSIRDISFLKKLEIETAEKSRELELIGEILDVPARQFGIFISTAQSLLAESIRLLKANRNADRELLKILLINMHTIKGSARALQLRHLTPLIHDVEQGMASVLQQEKPWDRNELLQGTQKVQDLIDHYLDLNQTKLGRNSADAIMLTSDFVGRLHHALCLVEKDAAASLRANVKPFRENLEDKTFVRAESTFREVLSNAEMLARDLRKESPDIVIQDSGIRLSIEGQDFVRKAFLHIIRNSMDHGIEPADERQRSGKAAKGRIDVLVEMRDDLIQIRYKDDGRGLNIRAIRSMAQKKGLIKEADRLNLEDFAYLIFEPGFSTSENVSDISGRGVGMNAVKEYVEQSNGTVSINLCTSDQVIDPEFVPFELFFTVGNRFFMTKAA
ncbi:MAG TPA: 7TM diverse intracellular signaling domain-containing protein [Oligoflexus sp.]|uniref:7TM diverse intracellular signaling domain-containing protein n=1 Tax=Oligoflexus sp. TaxID=1971216 RepID=UPI002D330862|nr:7TM diverse intracellular signaling domain-containing protein [Oligoflexus sp.]HYX37488.1 7TM diverse intracellular signaling domain-containing protein [Oligoflexus sp.]